MATRKKIEPADKTTETNQIKNHPLVFISHDSRDAELAEEFSNLLKSASAGALKSFRSSDKKGTQGIEYGLEWYPAIMDKIDESSEVICLLTQRSVERPWILYEAGVAKGKLDKTVIGIAMGISNKVAFTGPFAQFQNNDGSIDSITKLVLDLVRKIPGLDPDQQLVKQLVESFNTKTQEILTAQTEQDNENPSENINENIVGKLFEEVKIMFDSLPSRIENKISPERRKYKRSIHVFEEIIHMSEMNLEDPSLGFLMAISLYKEDIPWLYEIGMETYKILRDSKSGDQKEKAMYRFYKVLELTGHPIMREFYGDSKESYFFINESKHMFRRITERFLAKDLF